MKNDTNKPLLVEDVLEGRGGNRVLDTRKAPLPKNWGKMNFPVSLPNLKPMAASSLKMSDITVQPMVDPVLPVLLPPIDIQRIELVIFDAEERKVPKERQAKDGVYAVWPTEVFGVEGSKNETDPT